MELSIIDLIAAELMPVELWLAFVAASIAICVIPGPTVALVVAYSAAQGRRAVLALAAGVALGDCAAMSASLLGAGAIMRASATAFTLFKIAGAFYLIWLGWRLWRAEPRRVDVEAPPAAVGRLFRDAFVVTALNPKSIAFFIAFAPQFMDPTGLASLQGAVLTATFMAIAFANVTVYAFAAERMGRRLTRPETARWVNRIGGGVIAAMGAMLLAARR